MLSKLISYAGIAVISSGLVFGTTGVANASPVQAESAVSVQASELPVIALGIPPFPAKKLAAFAGCVFGVGVPIGLAIGVATNPGAWAWVVGAGPLPASIGGFASSYLTKVKNACRYALL